MPKESRCRPGRSDPVHAIGVQSGLTKGPQGQQLRVGQPNDVAFLRLGPTDDDVGPGLADFALNGLHARAFVVDDSGEYGAPRCRRPLRNGRGR